MLLLTVSMCVCAACCCCQTSDEQPVKPMVSVYPAASTVGPEGSGSLLCLASDMFPPLVRFSWKRQKEDGGLEELEGEQLEIRESGRTASILMIHQKGHSTEKYHCYVKHEGGTVEAHTQQELPAAAASCPPEREPADLPALQPADLSFQGECRVINLGNTATKYGKENEEKVIQFVEDHGHTVERKGFVVCPEHPWFGASPDGVLDLTQLLEIKCPLKSAASLEEFLGRQMETSADDDVPGAAVLSAAHLDSN
ncbi:uncharacterized protein KZ484_021840 [Pholidichthys leucotaenia]